ncbi:conserved hypothetical protein [Rippkaea orientalis PCC 8801]|uniref:Uncharacterized protein n=1 Tax=Rippkaea orientalis (strain PCC 8801 / RF-1) TaxID=41431 RepID=B7K456_RIPO1|nr:hypothetical protein [Rippkaea orientalis]ACK67762.1 conserved hypothetical protein [Rippkaea orientalis PCC 8801]
MKTKTQTKILHEGEYMAEIEVELSYNDDEWSPYLSLEDAEKLDTVRLALRDNDLKTAAKFACIYHLTPVRV